jgi:UDP-N-acetylglucosamine acyltransferase
MPELAATIHASAVIEGDVTIGDDVVIGPHCVLDGTLGPVGIGDGCHLIANCYLSGPLTMGRANTVWPAASLGGPPQDVEWNPSEPGAGLIIGNHNTFRESFTGHRAKTEEPTRIGNHNFFMACSHVGHDSQVGNHIQMANSAALGGHVTVGDRVIMGGGAAIHQFCRIGEGAFMQGHAGASVDIPPWCISRDINRIAGMNLIGMRRSGMAREDIARRRAVYRIIYRSDLGMPEVIKRLRSDGDPIAVEYADFIEQSERGICHDRDPASRHRSSD